MKKSKINKAVVCFLTIIFLLGQKTTVYATEIETESTSTVTTQTYNVMLLIDRSGSMNSTDENKMALDAAEQFIDQLSITYNDLSRATNVGVMTFGLTTELLSAPVGLDSETNTNLLKSAIKGITYDAKYTGGTDLGIAVYDAVNMLQKQAPKDGRNLIVMFTDGYSQRVVDEERSRKRLNDAFAIAGELECEIFVVGMNYDNTITSDGRKEIYEIADTTQLEEGIEEAEENDEKRQKQWEDVNYLITDNINSVREFYGKIYARMIGGGLEFLSQHQFVITTGGIREADVTVYSNSEITEVSMFDPDGNQMWEDGEKYFVYGHPDSFYKVIKILDPAIGTWTVEVKSADEDKAYVIRFYGIEMALSATWGAKAEFDDCDIDDAVNVAQVIVTPMYKTEQYKDDSFAESLDVAEFTVSKGEGENPQAYLLTYKEENGQFVGYFPVDSGVYHISAVLSSNTLFRKAEYDLNVNSGDENAGKTGDIDGLADGKKGDYDNAYRVEAIHVKIHSEKEFDLQDVLDGADITIRSAATDSSLKAGGDESISSASYEGTIITIAGNEIGNDKLQVEAVDEAGRRYSVTGDIVVEPEMLRYLLLRIIAILFLMTLALYLAIKKLTYIKGNFMVYIDNLNTGADFERTIDKHPRGEKFSLWKLVEKVIDDYSENPSEEEKAVCRILEKEKERIALRKIIICKSGNKKKKVYKLDSGQRKLIDLNRKTVGYESDSLQIEIEFERLKEDDSEWGQMVDDNPSKRKKYKRTPGK